MQLLHEIAKVSSLALGGELVPEAPHAGAEDREPIVHVLSGRQPINVKLVTFSQLEWKYLQLQCTRAHAHIGKVRQTAAI